MTALANFLHFSCEFVLLLTGLISPLAPLHTGCGLSDLYTQILSSWALNGKLQTAQKVPSRYKLTIHHHPLHWASPPRESTGLPSDLWCFTGLQCGHSSMPDLSDIGIAGSFLLGRCCASNAAPPISLPSLLTIPSHSDTAWAQFQPEQQNLRLLKTYFSVLNGSYTFFAITGNYNKDSQHFAFISVRLYLKIPKQSVIVTEDLELLCQQTWTG